MTQGIEYIIDASKKKTLDWKELWQYRELFFFFTWRDIKVKYKQTTLGVVWVVLQPVLTVLIFTLFFGRALQVDSAGLPYPIFVFSGLLLWHVFAASINSGGNSMLTQAPVIKKIYFPRIIIPVSSVLVSCIDFFIAFIVFVIMVLYYGVSVDPVAVVLCWPLAVALMLISTLGITCWLAALTVKYRDFRHVIPFGLQIGLFVSPVIYPISVLGDHWVKSLLGLNPMYAPIMLFRMAFTQAPDADPVMISMSIVSSLLFLIFGVVYFRKTEAYFADIA